MIWDWSLPGFNPLSFMLLLVPPDRYHLSWIFRQGGRSRFLSIRGKWGQPGATTHMAGSAPRCSGYPSPQKKERNRSTASGELRSHYKHNIRKLYMIRTPREDTIVASTSVRYQPCMFQTPTAGEKKPPENQEAKLAVKNWPQSGIEPETSCKKVYFATQSRNHTTRPLRQLRWSQQLLARIKPVRWRWYS